MKKWHQEKMTLAVFQKSESSSEAATGGALNNFANLTGKRLYWSLFLIKLQASGLQIY